MIYISQANPFLGPNLPSQNRLYDPGESGPRTEFAYLK